MGNGLTCEGLPGHGACSQVLHAGRETHATSTDVGMGDSLGHGADGILSSAGRVANAAATAAAREERMERYRAQITEKRGEVINFLNPDTHSSSQEKGKKQRKSAQKNLAREVKNLDARVQLAVVGCLETDTKKETDVRQDDDDIDMQAAVAMKTAAILGPIRSIQDMADMSLASVFCLGGRAPALDRPGEIQDDFLFSLTSDNYRLIGVFDGHGPDGTRVAAACRDIILRQLLDLLPSERGPYKKNLEIEDALKAAFATAQENLAGGPSVCKADALISGAAASVAVHDMTTGDIFVAWVGNCVCVAGVLSRHEAELAAMDGRPPKMEAVRLTKDHTTSNVVERDRITLAGLPIELRKGLEREEIFFKGERLPGIPLTRCLGNLVAMKAGLSSTPEIRWENSNADQRADRKSRRTMSNMSMSSVGSSRSGRSSRKVSKGAALDDGGVVKFLVMGSDGVFDVVRDEAIVRCIQEGDIHNVHYGVQVVVEKSRGIREKRAERVNGVVDDITLLVCWL